jgi:predicted metalloprotease
MDRRQRRNVDDRRGSGGGSGGMIVGGGLGTLIIAAIVFFRRRSFHIEFRQHTTFRKYRRKKRATTQEKKIGEMVDMMSSWNTQTWSQIFKENGMNFTEPRIVLFENTTSSGCGTAQSAMGLFIALQTRKSIWTWNFSVNSSKGSGQK